VNRQETIDAIMVGVEKTSYIIDRCAVYELLYLKVEAKASRNLEKTLLLLYTTILKYLAKSTKRLKGESPHHKATWTQLILFQRIS
jgi:hypothetical protein